MGCVGCRPDRLGRAAARRGGVGGGLFSGLDGAGRAVLGGGVWAAVRVHRAGAVARATGWVVGVRGVGRPWCGGLVRERWGEFDWFGPTAVF